MSVRSGNLPFLLISCSTRGVRWQWWDNVADLYSPKYHISNGKELCDVFIRNVSDFIVSFIGMWHFQYFLDDTRTSQKFSYELPQTQNEMSMYLNLPRRVFNGFKKCSTLVWGCIKAVVCILNYLIKIQISKGPEPTFWWCETSENSEESSSTPTKYLL